MKTYWLLVSSWPGKTTSSLLWLEIWGDWDDQSIFQKVHRACKEAFGLWDSTEGWQCISFDLVDDIMDEHGQTTSNKWESSPGRNLHVHVNAIVKYCVHPLLGSPVARLRQSGLSRDTIGLEFLIVPFYPNSERLLWPLGRDVHKSWPSVVCHHDSWCFKLGFSECPTHSSSNISKAQGLQGLF